MGLIIFFCNKPLVCSLSKSHCWRNEISKTWYIGLTIFWVLLLALCTPVVFYYFYYCQMCRLILPSKLLYMKRIQCSNHCSHYCEKIYIQSTTSYILSPQNSEWCQNDGFANKHTNCMWIQRGWVMVLMEY